MTDTPLSPFRFWRKDYIRTHAELRNQLIHLRGTHHDMTDAEIDAMLADRTPSCQSKRALEKDG